VLTLVGLVAVAAAVIASLWTEERFVVEGARLAPETGGVRVVGTVHNTGPDAAKVMVDISVVSAEGRLGEKETVELAAVPAGARVSFSSRLHPSDVRAYTIHVNEGMNPYGN
jgi:hypothetical protein